MEYNGIVEFKGVKLNIKQIIMFHQANCAICVEKQLYQDKSRISLDD